MSYGLSVTNGSNYLQIDSESPRLCAIYNGTYLASGSRVAAVTFPSPITTQEPPCIFIRNTPSKPNDAYTEMPMTGSPGNWTGFQIWAGNINSRPEGKWFAAVFGSVAQSQFGMRLWGPSGQIVFDSGSTPVVVTKASQSWAYAGYIQNPTLGGTHLYNNGVVAPIAEDEYFMMNPFSRGLLQPSLIDWTQAAARYDWTAQRLQIHAITNRPGGVWLDIGQPAAVYARLPGT